MRSNGMVIGSISSMFFVTNFTYRDLFYSLIFSNLLFNCIVIRILVGLFIYYLCHYHNS